MGDAYMPDPGRGGRGNHPRKFTARELKAQAAFDWVTFVDQNRFDVWGKQEPGPHDKPADEMRHGRRA